MREFIGKQKYLVVVYLFVLSNLSACVVPTYYLPANLKDSVNNEDLAKIRVDDPGPRINYRSFEIDGVSIANIGRSSTATSRYVYIEPGWHKIKLEKKEIKAVKRKKYIPERWVRSATPTSAMGYSMGLYPAYWKEWTEYHPYWINVQGWYKFETGPDYDAYFIVHSLVDQPTD